MFLFAMIAVLAQTSPVPPPTFQQPAPIPPANTWDGVAGFETIATDAATGHIIFPMGRQPTDALSRGCVFGLSNVRCPAPRGPRDFELMVVATRQQAERTNLAATAGLGDRIGCTTDADKSEERLCTFTEALHNSYVDERTRLAEEAAMTDEERDASLFDWGDDFLELTGKPETAAVGRLGFATGNANDKGGDPEPEPQAEQRSGCRREEYRNEDGSGWSVRFVCGSGDQRLLDSVMDRLRPPTN